jgi:hypothetical protein
MPMNAGILQRYIVRGMAAHLFALMDNMQVHNIRSLHRRMLQYLTLVSIEGS